VFLSEIPANVSMENKMKRYLTITAIIMLVLVLASCAGAVSSSPTVTRNTTTNQSTTSDSQSAGWQNQVTHAWVVEWPANWNADAENDGDRVWIELLDKNDNIVQYSNTNMPVEIELYSTQSTTYPWVKSRLLYSGEGVATSWEHDAFVTDAIGVKDISWQEISAPLSSENQQYGMLYITVTLPNGTNYSAEYDPADITSPNN